MHSTPGDSEQVSSTAGEWHGPDGYAATIGAICSPTELRLEDATISDVGDIVVLR